MAYRLPPTLEPTYACYLALLRVGFQSAEISINFGRLGLGTLDETFVILNAQNRTMYLSTNTYENCVKLWEKHEDFLRNKASEKFVDTRWSRSKYGTDPDKITDLMSKLKKAGFVLPGLQVKATEASIRSVDASEFGPG